jgi:hypothetical protein
MSKQSIPQKNNNSNLLAPPIEEVSVRTTLNIQKTTLEGMVKISEYKKLTFTAMTNEAL